LSSSLSLAANWSKSSSGTILQALNDVVPVLIINSSSRLASGDSKTHRNVCSRPEWYWATSFAPLDSASFPSPSCTLYTICLFSFYFLFYLVDSLRLYVPHKFHKVTSYVSPPFSCKIFFSPRKFSLKNVSKSASDIFLRASEEIWFCNVISLTIIHIV